MKNAMKAAVASTLCLVCMSTVAFAAERIAPENGKYSVSYADGTEGEYYSLVVVKGEYTESESPSITEESILHIDQVTAGESGAVFSDFVTMSNETASVYVGGSDLDSPVLLGYLSAETVTTYKVSFGVTSSTSKSVSVSLTASDSTYNAVYNSATGKYEVTVPAGIYKVVVTAPGHLSYTINAMSISDDAEKSVTLNGGDANGDGKVNYDDIAIVLNNYKQTTENGNFNGDGTVNYDDIAIILNNYKAKATVE